MVQSLVSELEHVCVRNGDACGIDEQIDVPILGSLLRRLDKFGKRKMKFKSINGCIITIILLFMLNDSKKCTCALKLRSTWRTSPA